MKTISANLQAHLDGESLTLCHCLKITRQDSTIHAHTDHATNLTVNSQLYKANGGFKISAIEFRNDGMADNLAIEGYPEDSDFIEDLRIGLFENAAFELLLVNHQDVTEYMILKTGRIGKCSWQDRNLYYMNLLGLCDYFQETTGRIIQEACDADLGDSRCGVTLATYTVTGTVTQVTDKKTFRDSSRTEADNYFQYGKLTWTSGNNNGLSEEVYSNASATDEFVLFRPMPYPIQVGDGYSVYAGCDKSFDTCKDKFSNQTNHRGFNLIPLQARINKLANLKIEE